MFRAPRALGGANGNAYPAWNGPAQPPLLSRMPRCLAALAAVFLLALAGCGASASSCRAAAVSQAHAENVWGSAIEVHNEAHESGDLDHSAVDEQLLNSRVDLIIASEAVRRACR